MQETEPANSYPKGGKKIQRKIKNIVSPRCLEDSLRVEKFSDTDHIYLFRHRPTFLDSTENIHIVLLYLLFLGFWNESTKDKKHDFSDS